MVNIYQSDYEFILSEIVISLDIPDSYFEDAEKKYQAVGTWLGEENSFLSRFSPGIYPQGSFQLGTVIKPINDIDEYDIDLVFELSINKNQITPKKLKDIVGARLKESEIYKKMLDIEGRRCWTINYAESAKFHLDILPAIPDDDSKIRLSKLGVPPSYSNTNIAITDKSLPSYDTFTLEWPSSNPKGFSLWFRERMKTQLEIQQKRFSEAYKIELEKVPFYKIKTPLQRSVQLLKRHRDIYFQGLDEGKPASIIITTLAALAYNNEASIIDALTKIINSMNDFIIMRDGIAWIQNPTDPSENFADRWQDYPLREKYFNEWLQKVIIDFNQLLNSEGIGNNTRLIENMFGEKITNLAVDKYKESIRSKRMIDIPEIMITNPSKPWGITIEK